MAEIDVLALAQRRSDRTYAKIIRSHLRALNESIKYARETGLMVIVYEENGNADALIARGLFDVEKLDD